MPIAVLMDDTPICAMPVALALCNDVCMTMTQTATILEMDLADRMKKALRISGLTVNDVADALDVNRNTVGNWTNGRIEPKRASVVAFAQLTGVPAEWLEFGIVPENWEGPARTRGLGMVRPEGFEPPAY